MSKHMDQTTVMTPALRQRLSEEASFNGWVVYFQAEGTVHTRHSGIAVVPDPMQEMIARDIVEKFNKEIGMGGTWLVQLTDLAQSPALMLSAPVYGCMRFMWMDEDGDVQFTVECWDDLVSVAMAGMIHWCEQAYEAWTHWKQQIDVLDLSDAHGQRKRVAKGEAMEAIDVDIEIGD